MRVINAPEPLDFKGPSIFLSGSIEMGAAENWQQKVERGLVDTSLTLLNPRRDDWDSSWVQSIDNPQFREQVEWELKAMDRADMIAMYFDPATKSPITLLELGLHAHRGKIVLCCPDGFWRKGNVEIVCRRYNLWQEDTLDGLIRRLVDYAEYAEAVDVR